HVEERVGGALVERRPLAVSRAAGVAGAEEAVAVGGEDGPHLGDVVVGGPEPDLGGPVGVLVFPCTTVAAGTTVAVGFVVGCRRGTDPGAFLFELADSP